MFVTTRMLEFPETEASSPRSLGHEISHVDLCHCIERLQYEPAARRIVGTLASILRLAHELVGVGYDEQQELESDRRGVLLGAAAGYDVVGGLSVFGRLARNEIEEGNTWRRIRRHWAARERAALIERNESEWRGERFYVGRSNLEVIASPPKTVFRQKRVATKSIVLLNRLEDRFLLFDL